MADAVGFWSYARDDDEAEGGRISRLAELIKVEYAMLTGDQIVVFVDREDLSWGDEWQSRIDEALEGTVFFIPVVTPRYFQRPECRRELLTFAGHAESLGVSELLLPVLYVDVPGLERDSDDEAIALVAKIHREDWRELRLEDETSPAYRKAVHGLAVRLAEIKTARQATPTDDTGRPEAAEAGEPEEDEAPGIFEILAGMEEAMPSWNETINALPEPMAALAAAAEEATSHIEVSDNAGKGFAGRLAAARNYAKAIEEPADRILELGTRYASDLVAVDAGMLTLIRLASEQTEEEDKQASCELFASVRGLAASSAENVESLQVFLKSLSETAKFSRDLRGPHDRIRAGLQRVMDGQAIMDEWVRQMDASALDCGDTMT